MPRTIKSKKTYPPCCSNTYGWTNPFKIQVHFLVGMSKLTKSHAVWVEWETAAHPPWRPCQPGTGSTPSTHHSVAATATHSLGWDIDPKAQYFDATQPSATLARLYQLSAVNFGTLWYQTYLPISPACDIIIIIPYNYIVWLGSPT
jgi:hypothetical protein